MTDFNTLPSRAGSGSIKWDEYPGYIPLWVADMDFKTAPCVIDAVRRRVEHGVFGYTLVRDEYYDALIRWFDTRHGYKITRGDVIYTSGVIPALAATLRALVRPGDGVIVLTPIYNHFYSLIRNGGFRVTECPLIAETACEGEFDYRIDFDRLESLAADSSNTMMLLCNPHNPGGRVWTPDELRGIRDICRRHGVQVVSDEIHCELTMPGYTYTPYGTIDSDAIVCLSPSKSFNFAGLQIANIVIPSAEKRQLIDQAINTNEVCDVNPLGVEALIAAYSDKGAEWLGELKEYLASNWEYTRRFFHTHFPQCRLAHLEATYLPWIDVSGLGVSGTQFAQLVEEQCKVKVNGGEMYGDDHYIRINIACPRSMLEEAYSRLIDLKI